MVGIRCTEQFFEYWGLLAALVLEVAQNWRHDQILISIAIEVSERGHGIVPRHHVLKRIIWPQQFHPFRRAVAALARKVSWGNVSSGLEDDKAARSLVGRLHKIESTDKSYTQVCQGIFTRFDLFKS